MYSERRIKYGDNGDPERPELLMFPPCETCRVEIMPENTVALRIYMMTRSQYIMGFNGPIDVNHMAIWTAIEKYKKKYRISEEDEVDIFERVTQCARIIISDTMQKDKPVEA